MSVMSDRVLTLSTLGGHEVVLQVPSLNSVRHVLDRDEVVDMLAERPGYAPSEVLAGDRIVSPAELVADLETDTLTVLSGPVPMKVNLTSETPRKNSPKQKTKLDERREQHPVIVPPSAMDWAQDEILRWQPLGPVVPVLMPIAGAAMPVLVPVPLFHPVAGWSWVWQ